MKAERVANLDGAWASALYLGSDWQLFAGAGRVFWGKGEVNHLVDFINQDDGVEDIDAEDKLGQPMVSLTLERSWGALDIIYMPYFRERSYAGCDARLRGPLPVADAAVYEADTGRWHPDLAVRWSHFVGDLDVGASVFRGTSREPRLVPATEEESPVLVANYDIIEQIAVDAQWTRNATLWKLEALTQRQQGDLFAAGVLGVENTFFGLASGSSDLGVLAEISSTAVTGRLRPRSSTTTSSSARAGPGTTRRIPQSSVGR